MPRPPTTPAAMAELAAETGGEVFKNSNDLSHAVSRAIQNGSHYYTISYTPTDKKMDGQFRAIQVKLNKGDYRLAYRRGYYAFDTLNAKSTPESSDPLHPLLERGAPAFNQDSLRSSSPSHRAPACSKRTARRGQRQTRGAGHALQSRLHDPLDRP